MGFGISGTTSTNQALLSQGTHQAGLTKTLAQLSSGLAINSSADNPSGAAIAAFLQAGVNGTDAGTQNDINAANAANVAQGASQSIEGGLQTLNSLSIEAGNGLLSSSDLQNIQGEANQIVQQANTVSTQTNFNGVDLLQGSNITVQSGSNEGNTTTLSTPNVTSASLGTSSIDLTSFNGEQNAIGAVQGAIQTLTTQQAQLGAQQVSINEDIDNNNVLSVNLQASESSIADLNVGQASTQASSNSIQSQIATSVVSQLQADNSAYAGIFANHLA